MREEYVVRITEYAKEQITDVYKYICYDLQSVDVGNRWLNNIEGNILKALSFMPKRFKILDVEKYKERDVRKLILKNYYAYFWIDDSKNTVWVIAFVYSRMDQTGQIEQIIEGN